MSTRGTTHKGRGGIERNRNKQPLSQEEEIRTKNPTTRNNLNTRHHKGWNQLESPWHAALVGTDKVKSGEHALPCPPNKPGGIHGTKLTLVLLCAWTVYIICKVTKGVIKVVHNWLFDGTHFHRATKNCPVHVRCTRRHLNSG